MPRLHDASECVAPTARSKSKPESPTLNSTVFSRKIRVEYESNGQRKPCELKWLDSFSMRNFTNDAVFDDTLPLTDGMMEIGSRVPLDKLQDALEDWLRRKSYIGKDEPVRVTEENPS